MGQKVAGNPKFRRHCGMLIPAVVGVPVVILLFFIVFYMKAEALSPDEIMAKEDWSDEELQNALARSMSPAMASQRKGEVMKHLGQQLKKRTPDQQERIRRDAVVAAVTTSLKQVRKMPEQERNNMISTIQTKAEANYHRITTSSKERAQVAARLQSREMEAFTAEVNRVIFSELTPAERVQFAPITKLWIKTMKVVSH